VNERLSNLPNRRASQYNLSSVTNGRCNFRNLIWSGVGFCRFDVLQNLLLETRVDLRPIQFSFKLLQFGLNGLNGLLIVVVVRERYVRRVAPEGNCSALNVPGHVEGIIGHSQYSSKQVHRPVHALELAI
jgi:hypothetical protein